MNLRDEQDINRTWKNIREAIKISVKESLGVYEQKQHNHGLIKNVNIFYIKGSRFKCGVSRIQTKVI